MNNDIRARLERIKARTLETIEKNPVATVAAVGTLLVGGAKLMDANTRRKNSKVWKEEVERRKLGMF